MLHMWMRHVAHVNASCRTCECVTSHMWMRHAAHVNASRRTCGWMTTHCLLTLSWLHTASQMCHAAHVYESRHICECVTLHMWMRHVTQSSVATLHQIRHVVHVNWSCCTCVWVIPHMWMRHVAHMKESCHTVYYRNRAQDQVKAVRHLTRVLSSSVSNIVCVCAYVTWVLLQF